MRTFTGCHGNGTFRMQPRSMIIVILGPDDCYEEDGEFYRGSVSVTVDGSQCLDWNSAFIRQKGGNPFQDYAGFDGIGPHNDCRSEGNLCKEFPCLPLS